MYYIKKVKDKVTTKTTSKEVIYFYKLLGKPLYYLLGYLKKLKE